MRRFLRTYMMAITSKWVPYSSLSDEDLTAAIKKIEAEELSFVEGGGQRTTSIGGVSFSYGSRAELLRIKEDLIAAYNARVAGAAHYAPYKITHLMR